MRLAVVVLILLGLLAAGAAALLVQALQANQGGQREVPEVEVLVVEADLPAMTILKADHVKTDKAPLTDLPAGYLNDPIQAVGKVLAVGLVQGQVLTRDHLISGGSSEAFTAVIPTGMRAYTISLSSRAVGGGLVYPGCVVDILAAFRLPKSMEGDALSTTLMQNIQVLAIEDKSVVTPRKTEEEEGKPAKRQSDRTVAVTLLVNSKQASALQLAIEHGHIAVALRNPLDRESVNMEGMVLNSGRLGGETMKPEDLEEIEKVFYSNTEANSAPLTAQTTQTTQSSPSSSMSTSPVRARSTWDVTVIRGQDVELEEFTVEAVQP